MKNKGQSVVEYGLILALAAIVCISSLRLLGSSISDQLSGLADTIGRASGVTIAAAGGTAGTPSGSLGQPGSITGIAGQPTGSENANNGSNPAVDNNAGTNPGAANGSNNTPINGDTGTSTGTVPTSPSTALEDKPTDVAAPNASQGFVNFCGNGGNSADCVNSSNIDAGSSWGF